MNNATSTQYTSEETRMRAEDCRKSFAFAVKQYNNRFGYEGNETSFFLKCLGQMLDNSNDAKLVAAACRSALHVIAPFREYLLLEFAELGRLTYFLEMSVDRDKSHGA